MSKHPKKKNTPYPTGRRYRSVKELMEGEKMPKKVRKAVKALQTKFHNPKKLSQKEIGEGYRFLLIGELPKEGDEIHCWDGIWRESLNWATNTYRTKRPLPSEQPQSPSEAERQVLALFYKTNGEPKTAKAKIQTISRFLKTKNPRFGTGGKVTKADRLGMAEEAYLEKIGVRKRP